MNSRMCQHQRQGVLLDPRGSVEAHLIDPIQQVRFPDQHSRLNQRKRRKQVGLGHKNSQSELLEGLDGVQR